MNFRQNHDIAWNMQHSSARSMRADSPASYDFENDLAWYEESQGQVLSDYPDPASFLIMENDQSLFPPTPAAVADKQMKHLGSPNSIYHMRIKMPQHSPVSNGFFSPAQKLTSPLSVTSPLGKQTPASIATTFYPGNPEVAPGPDLVLASSEGTLFFLNSHLLSNSGFLLPSSCQGFPIDNLPSSPRSPFLSPRTVAKLPDTSATLSIIFHALYKLSSGTIFSSFQAVSLALSRMASYGLCPSEVVQRGTPFYAHLMAKWAPLQPLKLYALAAQYRIENLAVDVSSHLLGLHLSEVTDDLAKMMGSVYLKRLFFMHKGRTERLKSVLVMPPALHHDVKVDCDDTLKNGVKRKWALLITSLAWEAKPDISPHALQQHLSLLGQGISCQECRRSWMERVAAASNEWSSVKFTI